MITGGGAGSGVLVSGTCGSVVGTGVELGVVVTATDVGCELGTGVLGATATDSGPHPMSIAVPRTKIANLATDTGRLSK